VRLRYVQVSGNLHPSIDATIPKSFGGATEPVVVDEEYSRISSAPEIYFSMGFAKHLQLLTRC
jgi:hypothetical protein